MTPLRLALALLFVLPACRRHRGRPSGAAVRWYVHPADGRSVRVEGDRAIHGALRFTERAVAPGPWPSTRIAATARRGDVWLFASEDGSVYRAERFDGPLRVVAELPAPLVAAYTPGYHLSRGVHSLGALFAVDVFRRAHAVSADGSVRPLGLERVITGAFGAERVAIAVTEPGVLRVSEDGGATFRAVRAPSGIPLRVNVVDGETFVVTTGGVYRWQAGAMAPVDPAPSRSAWVDTTRAARVLVNTFANSGFRLPAEPGRAAFDRDGAATGVADQTLITLDPVTGRERRREPAPGADCGAHASGAGLRLVCRHDGWAQAVYAKGASGWTALRDESRAEPMGPVAFDDAGGAWAVSAPCAQRPERDPHLVCAYAADNTHRELRAPFPAEVVSVHDGAVLAVDTATSPSAGPTRAVIFRGDEATPLSLPVSGAAARGARQAGGRIYLWEPPTASRPRLALVVGSPAGRSFEWRTIEAPAGATRGVHGPNEIEVAVGTTAAAVWQSARGGAFRPLPSPVRGAGETLAIDPAEPLRCLGAYCQLGEGLTLAFRSSPQALAVARRTPPGASPAARPREEQRRIHCRLGARSPGPEMDQGVASTGYTVQWTLAGRSLTVRWAGDAFPAAAVTGALPQRADARVQVHGVPGAQGPVALVEQCNDVACDTLVATPAGLAVLPLGRPEPGVELFEGAGGRHLVRFDTVIDGTRVATLVRFDPGGAERGRRDFVLAGDAGDAHVGRFGDVDGLWVRDDEATLRFYPLDGDDEGRALTTARAPDRATAFCAPGETARGELRMRSHPAQVAGDGWFVEAGTWQVEEALDLTASGFCVRAIGGGEARPEAQARAEGVAEHEPVRTFAVTASSATSMTGRAWQGRERIELSCEPRDPPREAVNPGSR
ncbi:MAG: hypothetical protein U0324_47410 [Polyangiales bacterium]